MGCPCVEEEERRKGRRKWEESWFRPASNPRLGESSVKVESLSIMENHYHFR
jgi:hypothetical protein